ncbi:MULTISPECIES: hypothetical protein [Vibrio]|uniref:Uncharacterized protein n=1 Tax=Vibrio mediterranei TaxID=689 RepID=A0A2C9PEP6_9VIBR|nr:MULTISPECIES: hypothetical protein [Vibrio]ASI90924.1 hypothetical protein BSZ05_14630 [Vibrio mediterranei]AYV19777.1 hypothetical protein ECB94_00060 [Vibrio mediterranei]EDL51242.1 hypothetical protein VSAK1_11515 [Vibrio mediterranei AK1]MCF4174856.1 hypothetical protein [Vibrio sp. McD22-P3]MCG9658715.1 hypothetical protein [Vibrio mediterranei]
MHQHHKGIWVAYILSLFTPFTLLLSGVIAIIYAGYRLDKGEDSEVVNSHYYGLIRTFFLNLTFFVVLIVTVATSNGLLKGVTNYWYKASWIDQIANIIPYIGMLFAAVAIVMWIIRMFMGMSKLNQNIAMTFGNTEQPIQHLP